MNTNDSNLCHNLQAKYDEKTPHLGFVFHKENTPAICINRQPIVTQTQMGQLNIQQLYCSTSCPFANISKNESGEFVYNIDCKSKQLSILLKNAAEIEKVITKLNAPKEETKIAGGLIVA